MINRITFTGADESVRAIDLARLSDKFPFIEWGILISRTRYGTFRFPTENWLNRLRDVKTEFPYMKLSCHLCGGYVRDLVKGDSRVITMLDRSGQWKMFERVQINFHAIPHSYSNELITLLNNFPEKEFIFQHDGVNEEIVKTLAKKGCNVSALFDKSGGAGILPSAWPSLLPDIKCGYAGGLSPDNLGEQMHAIELKVGEIDTWIDMETHIRSNSDRTFDLEKVNACIKKFLAVEEQNT